MRTLKGKMQWVLACETTCLDSIEEEGELKQQAGRPRAAFSQNNKKQVMLTALQPLL
jgi:hypothetical protein